MVQTGLSVLQQIERMRGQLPAEEPGARGIEHWARNPACQRLGALVLAGIAPTTVMQSVYQESLHKEQSPFALLRGITFERSLFENNAARLIDLYQKAGLLPASPRVVNLDLLVPQTNAAALAHRRALTQRYIQEKLRRDTHAPHMIIHSRLQFTLYNVPHDIEPDLLIASEADPCYRPGEIKSFPDREGKTDRADLRGALRQAAVAVLGLRQLLSQWGIPFPERLVLPRADLILRVLGSSYATLRPMTLRQECASIQVILAQAPQVFHTLEQQLLAIGLHAALDQPGVLDQIPNHFTPTCKEFCPLAPHCKKQAQQRSEPIVLGNQACQELAPAGTLARAWNLLNGHPPATPDEQDVAQRLQEAVSEWKKGVT
ncbi:MAG TPA: hypothetical protein VFV38_21615 [Ktedonobacteraceae bacterium]|nr:hypothetical protein [Ktedonobacteraceae bacterium]